MSKGKNKPKPSKFYVVWKGRQTGIFNTWEECSAQVTGFVDARYKAFESKAAAEAAFRGDYEDYVGKPTREPDPAKLQALLKRVGQPITPSWAVDAACSGSPGPLEYRGVEVGSGAPLFKQGPFAQGNNNVGEFLALVHALALCQQRGLSIPIYSDSITAIAWVRGRECKTDLPRTEANAPLFDLIARAEAWLKDNVYTNAVLKWESEVWGENPADFGRK